MGNTVDGRNSLKKRCLDAHRVHANKHSKKCRAKRRANFLYLAPKKVKPLEAFFSITTYRKSSITFYIGFFNVLRRFHFILYLVASSLQTNFSSDW